MGRLYIGHRTSFFRRLGFTNYAQHHKDQKKRQMLERLADTLDMPLNSYDYGNGAGGPTDAVMASSMMLPWLLYKWRWGDSTRPLVSPIIRSWLQFASAGLRHLPDGSEYVVRGRFFTSLREDTMTVDKTTQTIPNWLAILGAHEWLTHWVNFCGNADFAGLRPDPCPSTCVANILLFLVHTAGPGFWYLKKKAKCAC